MSVFNVLPSGVNTIFPTFWKHRDTLFKKGLWLAAYPLPNSLDDGVVVRKLHALQVWFEPSKQVEITRGQIGTVWRMCQKVPFQFPEGFHCCFCRMGACIVLKESYPLSTCLPLGLDLFLHVHCQEVWVISCIDCSGICQKVYMDNPLPVPEELCHHFCCRMAPPRSLGFGRTGMPPLAWWLLGLGSEVVHPRFIGGHYRLKKCITIVFKLL